MKNVFGRVNMVIRLWILGCGCSCVLMAQERTADLALRYDRPAEYFEEALVIGNGTMGAIVYGGTEREIISLNDITLWTGEPERGVTTPDAHKSIPVIRELLDKEDYRGADREQKKVQGHYSENYQPLGQLTITYQESKVTDYVRSLDISNAIARTSYRKDGHPFMAEYFASAPDSVIVIRLKSESKEGICALLSYNSQLPHSITANENGIMAEGYAAYHSYPIYYNEANYKHIYDPERGTRFRTLIRVLPKDGVVKHYATGELKLEGVHEAIILVTNVTSFNGFDRDPVTEGRDYRKLAMLRMEKASGKNYQELQEVHVSDYKNFFGRVELDLGQTAPEIAALPTDKQLMQYTDKKQDNPELEALYFQYGRYLLISCSRTPGVPANLQGLWNEKLLPPWSCKVTTKK